MNKNRGVDSERWKSLKWKKGQPRAGGGRYIHRNDGVPYNIGANKRKRAWRAKGHKGAKLQRLASYPGVRP